MTVIDWQMICLDLRRNYKNLDAVAKEIGSSWQHLNRLARGDVRQPRFDVGMKLLDLHSRHCPNRKTVVVLNESAIRMVMP